TGNKEEDGRLQIQDLHVPETSHCAKYSNTPGAPFLASFARSGLLPSRQEELSMNSLFKTALSILALCLIASLSHAQQPANSCTAAEQKQLDFWVGEWDLTWPGAKDGEVAHGTNSIKRVLDGCVVEESFSAGDSGHLRGTSVSIFDNA